MTRKEESCSSLTGRREALQEYYGKVLKSKQDLDKKVCCTTETTSRYARVLAVLPEEVKAKHYGCGCPIPEDDLEGLTVLDLGSGAGLDCFLLAHEVGPGGKVLGIDMTAEQLEVARRNTPAAMDAFGFAEPNVEFHEGFIETAESITDGSVDIVVSSCVVNLSPAKDQVFRNIHRVLRNGGEFYISDIAADRHVPESIASDPRMVAECLGGAMYEHEWFDVMRDAGFGDPRVVRRTVVATDVAGEPITFFSLTVRGVKLARPLDRRCEDFGQLATYRGSIPGHPARFTLDDHHVFEARRPMAVCRNTARMLSETRLSPHFDVTAPIRHFGIFPCGPAPAPAPTAGNCGPGCC